MPETPVPDAPPDNADTPDPRPRASSDGAWRRLARAAAPRSTKAQALAALLTVALGFAIVTQVQQTQVGGLDAMRQDDLVRVLDDVSQRSSRLDQQANDLQAQRDQLASGAGSSQAAIDQAARRLDTLRILAGTVPAHGPGIQMTIEDPDSKVTAPMLLDVLQELRDAGAEVVQFGDTRIVAGSWFAASGSDVQVDGQPLARPFLIRAVGDPQTLASAMSIPGGIVETVRRQGATAGIEQLTTVVVDALATPRTPRYAQPVPDAVTPTK
ncbi:MAG: DUF881 domain-containing protein [Lapillicoccus sp.]